jgi:type III secretion system FlhB-like substrate exporter
MPQFAVEQYELHACTYHVTADSAAEAIHKVLNGGETMVDNSGKYIEVAEDVGLPCDEYRDIVEALQRLGDRIPESHIPSIRSVEEI